MESERTMRILSVQEGRETTETMNNLAQFLLMNNLIKCETVAGKECGVQEASYALCDFEVHIVKKRYRM